MQLIRFNFFNYTAKEDEIDVIIGGCLKKEIME